MTLISLQYWYAETIELSQTPKSLVFQIPLGRSQKRRKKTTLTRLGLILRLYTITPQRGAIRVRTDEVPPITANDTPNVNIVSGRRSGKDLRREQAYTVQAANAR